MNPEAKHLLGAWQLVSWSLVYADGRPAEYPLGEDAAGIIMYTPDGHVSATLMQKQRPAAAPATDAEKATAYSESFAYAGRDAAAEDVGFYYAANAADRLAGMVLSGVLAAAGGLVACLWGSAAMLAACALASIALPASRGPRRPA